MNEFEVIKQCQLDDLQAFNYLFKLYGSKAYRTAFLIVGKREIAEDIVQESFIQCFKEIKKLRNPITFQAWFYRIIIRLSWRIASKEKKHSCYESLDSERCIASSTCYDFTERLEWNETCESLKIALDMLDKNLRTTIVLYYFNELSIKDISKVMNCFEGTVKSRLFNARKKLEKELIQSSSEGPKMYEKECNVNV